MFWFCFRITTQCVLRCNLVANSFVGGDLINQKHTQKLIHLALDLGVFLSILLSTKYLLVCAQMDAFWRSAKY